MELGLGLGLGLGIEVGERVGEGHPQLDQVALLVKPTTTRTACVSDRG